MNKALQASLSVLVLTVFSVAAYFVWAKQPTELARAVSKVEPISVEVVEIKTQPYQVSVPSFGTVRPRTQTSLQAQVAGQIISIAADFQEGSFFDKGDLLLEVDARDYQVQIAISEAELKAAEQQREEERARVKQAKDDWLRSGNKTEAPEIVLRKPQLAAAEASVAAAKAKLDQAKLNLQRTRVLAPYAGRVLQKHIGVGELVSPNTVLGEIYATDYVEVRLPLKNQALNFIDLPETYRNQPSTAVTSLDVAIKSTLGGAAQSWQGKVVRTEGAIDAQTNQLYVIAQIDDPYKKRPGQNLALKIGQYVEAKIFARRILDAVVIPEQALYQGTYVYLYRDGVLQRQDVEIAWRDSPDVIVKAGLAVGDKLVVTTLGQVSSGTPAKIFSAAEKNERNQTAKDGPGS